MRLIHQKTIYISLFCSLLCTPLSAQFLPDFSDNSSDTEYSSSTSLKNNEDELSHHSVAANDFLNTLGINSSLWTRSEKLDKVIECIKYCGFRWVRSGSMEDYSIEKYRRLYEETGAKVSYGGAPPKVIEEGKELASIGVLLAFEGPNEPNNWTVEFEGEIGGGSGTWLPVAKYQANLYESVKAEPELAKYPVFGVSEVGGMVDNVGLQYLTIPEGANTMMPDGTRFADYFNIHNYVTHPGWWGLHDNQTWVAASPYSDCRVDGLYGNQCVLWHKKWKGLSEQEVASLPRVTTETGTTINDEYDIDEEMQAKLLTNLYLAQYKRGWSYTAVYLLSDRTDEGGNQTFGFYKRGYPDYKPRQAAHYMHNFTTILADDAHASTQAGGISYYIQGNNNNTVHDLLLRKSNGRYFLIIWGENYKSAASEISIQLDKKYGTIKVYDITKGINATKIYTDTDVVPLSVKDYAFILEFNENSESVNIEKNNIEQLHYFNQASELHLIGNASIRTLSIYNIGGTRVLYQEFPENIVSLANLPKGSYIIQTTNINGKKKVKKIVK
ncbi:MULTISPECIES: T9SS type A sorting domain-containing protein [Bacteroidales]|uniref:T9SS type A sorting domain-containing protein n=1 Tax=Bacteroidales TaxID=171549 RepID=UPI000AFCD487|nr:MULTISPECIES: T9SS type A sorting domain-containing protein [Bacteroidales]